MQCNFKYNTFKDIEKEIKSNIDKKVCILLMSGGIDSSTSLILLQKKLYHVIGVHYDFGYTYKTNLDNKCCNLKDLNDAYNIANKFGIKLFNIDYKEKFRKTIIEKFIDKKSKGEHFNPCTLCHDKIKYGDILKLVKKYKIKIASGYYCKIENGKLMMPKDIKKNQTQSLIMKIKKEDLKYFEFPLGDYLKSEVREIAKNNGIKIFNKKDSMGLCFVGEKNIKDFIKNYCQLKSGNIYLFDNSGILKNLNIKHKGLGLYQIGENSGFNTIINGKPTPLFVHSKRYKTNDIILCKKELIKTDVFCSTKFNILDNIESNNIKVQYNSNMPSLPCIIEIHKNASLKQKNKIKLIIKLKKKIEGIIPGEIFLLYKGGRILLGGKIHLTF